MEISQLYSNRESVCQRLDAVIQKEVMKIRNMPAQWKNVLPAPICYQSEFSWQENTVPLRAKQSVGTFVEIGLKEEKNTPTIDFAISNDYVNLYTYGSSIMASEDEIDAFNLWTSRGGFDNTSFVAQLIESANDTYTSVHDRLFFSGDGEKTKGLLHSDACVDMTSSFSSETDSLQLIMSVIGKVREVSLGIVKVGTILISPAFYSHLCRYYKSSDLSNLEKIMKQPIDSTPEGGVVNLKVMVLDRLSETVTTDHPYGSVYFMSRDASQFRYYYKPLLISPFRNVMLRSFGAPIKFKYSDPVVFTKYALVKVDVPKTIDETTNAVSAASAKISATANKSK